METAIMSAMCRCCASEGVFKDVKSSYTWMGDEEVYADMLRECFDIHLSTSEHCEDGGICEVCITQLRNASNFKKQVLHTEEQFKKHINNKLFKPSIVKVEVSAEEDNDSDDNNMSAEEAYSGPEFEIPIKTETEEPKPKKRAASSKATTSRAKKAKGDSGESSSKRSSAVSPLKVLIKIEPEESSVNDSKTKKIITTTCKPNSMSNNSKDKKVTTSSSDLKSEKDTSMSNNLKDKKVTESSNDLKSEEDTSTSKQVPLVPICREEVRKHRTNIIEVLRCSNATPIRRFEDVGYQCCYCKDQFVLPADLKKHTLETHHDVRKACFMKMGMKSLVVRLDITGLRCRLCNQDLDTLELLLEHLKDVHHKTINTDIKNLMTPFQFIKETAQCCVCKNTFDRFKILLQHLNLHYRNCICELCDTGFTILSSLRKHIKRVHNTGEFKCDHCSKVFETDANKKSHERAMHSHKSNLYKCRICNKSFEEYRFKEAHLVSMHGLKVPKNKCNACNKIYKTKRALYVHIKKNHLMERPHKCAECDMSFFEARELHQHMIKHTKARTHKCTICTKAFTRAYTLKEHMKIHNNVRRFKCEHCEQAFVQKCSWKSHMKSKHGEIV